VLGLGITEENRRWWVLGSMTVALLPLSIGGFGYVVTLPAIASDLHGTAADLAWTLNIEVLFFGASTMVMGRLADVIGRRRMVGAGMLAVILSSVACALAPSVELLIVFRGLQGISFGMVYGASLPIVSTAFPDEQRATGLGMWAAGYLIGAVLGTPLAGLLADAVSWRALFWLSVPLMLIALGLTSMAVPESRDPTVPRRIDWFGVILPALGILSLLYSLQEANDVGWDAPSIVAGFIAAAVLLTLFIVVERRAQQPLIDFGLFRNRTYRVSCGVGMVSQISQGAILFFVPLFLESALGLSALTAGISLLALTVPMFVLALIAGRMLARYGGRSLMVAGAALLALSSGVLLAVGSKRGFGLVLLALVVNGVGASLAFNASNITGVESIEAEHSGLAFGVMSQIRLIGYMLGVALPLAVFNALAFHRLDQLAGLTGSGLTSDQLSEIRAVLAGSDSARSQLVSASPGVAHDLDNVVRTAFASGLRGAMALVTAAGVVGVVIALRTRRAETAPTSESGGWPGKAHAHGPAR